MRLKTHSDETPRARSRRNASARASDLRRDTPASLPEPPSTPIAASLRRMLDVISHELRTPLNGIQSWSHVLENELSRTLGVESGRDQAIDPSPVAQRALAGIRIGVREQVKLIDQLLDVSRAMNGKLTLDRRPVAIQPILESALAGVQPQAAERHVTLHADYDCIDCQVDGDADRLRQALCHVLCNAIKFSAENGEVRVTLHREGNEVVIAVADQGSGVPEEAHREIFDWFQRGGRRQGLGIGLALTRHFVRLHGGEVEVASVPGEGAVFTLRLPSLQLAETATEEPASAPRDDRAAPPDRSAPEAPTPPA